MLKFGGSTLASAEDFLGGAGLVADTAREGEVAVVVSAMRGVTDRLFTVVRALRLDDPDFALSETRGVSHFHQTATRALALQGDEERGVRLEIEALSGDLEALVGRSGDREVSAEIADRITSFGERWSSRLFAAAVRKLGAPAKAVDSSSFLLTTANFQHAQPLVPESLTRTREALEPLLDAGITPVVTGFIGATPDGRVTTLGRNSSDFSAAIVACGLEARELTIWTSVDGFFAADPWHSVDAAYHPWLSYKQALELARDGARVVHPKAIELLAERRIPLRVRNAFRPNSAGTWVGERT